MIDLWRALTEPSQVAGIAMAVFAALFIGVYAALRSWRLVEEMNLATSVQLRDEMLRATSRPIYARYMDERGYMRVACYYGDSVAVRSVVAGGEIRAGDAVVVDGLAAARSLNERAREEFMDRWRAEHPFPTKRRKP